jgi:DNA ligase-1
LVEGIFKHPPSPSLSTDTT